MCNKVEGRHTAHSGYVKAELVHIGAVRTTRFSVSMPERIIIVEIYDP